MCIPFNCRTVPMVFLAVITPLISATLCEASIITFKEITVVVFGDVNDPNGNPVSGPHTFRAFLSEEDVFAEDSIDVDPSSPGDFPDSEDAGIFWTSGEGVQLINFDGKLGDVFKRPQEGGFVSGGKVGFADTRESDTKVRFGTALADPTRLMTKRFRFCVQGPLPGSLVQVRLDQTFNRSLVAELRFTSSTTAEFSIQEINGTVHLPLNVPVTATPQTSQEFEITLTKGLDLAPGGPTDRTWVGSIKADSIPFGRSNNLFFTDTSRSLVPALPLVDPFVAGVLVPVPSSMALATMGVFAAVVFVRGGRKKAYAA